MRNFFKKIHHFNRALWHTPLLVLVAVTVLLSVSLCTTSDPVEAGIMERTDLTFTGDISMQAFLQNPQDEGSDLIEMMGYGVPVSRLDIAMDLGSGYALYLKVFNGIAVDLSDLINYQYNIYSPEEQEDKQYYVLAELRQEGENPTYYSNLGDNLPPGTNINALTLRCDDDLQMHGRLRDVVLYNNTDPQRSLLLNGTFVSALELNGEITIIK